MHPIIVSGIIWRWVERRFARELQAYAIKGIPLTAWGYSAKGTTVVFSADGSVQVATEMRPGLLNVRMVCFANAGGPFTPARDPSSRVIG